MKIWIRGDQRSRQDTYLYSNFILYLYRYQLKIRKWQLMMQISIISIGFLLMVIVQVCCVVKKAFLSWYFLNDRDKISVLSAPKIEQTLRRVPNLIFKRIDWLNKPGCFYGPQGFFSVGYNSRMTTGCKQV